MDGSSTIGWRQRAQPDDITVLPKAWRSADEGVTIGRLQEETIRGRGCDHEILLATDEETIETIGIPTDQRLTVCVQPGGCPMACRFCATGKDGLQRSLHTQEIVDQVLSVREAMDRRPSHIVFMGMGEPLLNSQAFLEAIRCPTMISVSVSAGSP